MRCVVVLSAVFVLSLGRIALATDPLREAVDRIAKTTLQLMDDRGFNSVTVHGVEDGTNYGATSASGIEKMLKDNFSAVGRLKNARADVGIKGKLLAAKPEPSRRDAIEAVEGIRNLQIQLVFTDLDGQPLPDFDKVYYLDRPDQDSIDKETRVGRDGRKKDRVAVQGATFSQDVESAEATLVAFGASGPVDLQSTAITLKSPQAVLADNDRVAKVEINSPFGVRIVTQKGVKPLRMVDGLPFVDLEQGEEFTIDIRSSSREHIAATVTVDGLNSFYFSKTPQAHGSSWIIAPHPTPGQSSSLGLEGWYIRQGIADKFVATTFADSKRKKAGLGETTNGAITVAFGPTLKKLSFNGKSFDEVWKVPRKSSITVLSVDGEEVETEIVENSFETRIRELTYIGGSGEVKQIEGAPSNYMPQEASEIVTIRYRHPREK